MGMKDCPEMSTEGFKTTTNETKSLFVFIITICLVINTSVVKNLLI